MTDEIRKNLVDILESIISIDSYLGSNRDFNLYLNNKMLRRAIERELEIIGEAMSRTLKLDSTINISSKVQFIGMRNRVIHGYDKVDNTIVWGTIIRHLPILKVEIENLLE